MKQNFAPNAELGELLALLQETVQVCGKHLTDRVICQCTGMSSKTYTASKAIFSNCIYAGVPAKKVQDNINWTRERIKEKKI